MSSVVDICNLALSHLGDEATVASISPPEGSDQASHCAQFYPMARDAMLEMHAWSFSTRRVSLAEYSGDPPDSWQFAYALPSDCLKARAVLLPGETDDTDTQDYAIESVAGGALVVYTNVEAATLLYTVRITDTSKFGPLFVLALARLLSAYLAGPVIRGDAGANVAKSMLQIFKGVRGEPGELDEAKTADANARQSNPYTNAIPASIAARS